MGYLFHLFCFVFLDVLGFSIILPLLPYYAAELHASPSSVGMCLTANALAQLLTAPFIGKLSDSYGRRPVLLACVLGTCISFIMLYYSTSIEMILISRIVDGLLGGNISLAQAYIADITNEKDRSKGFGVLGAAFGLAFIVGPATGAVVLSRFHSTKIPSMIAAILAVLNLLGIYFFLPESFVPKAKQARRPESNNNLILTWLNFHFPLRNVSGKLKTLLILRLSYGLIFSLFETTIGLYTSSVLNLPAKTSNMFFVFVGIFFSGIQGYIRRVSIPNEVNLIKYSFVVAGLSIFAMSYCHTIPMLLVVLLPFSISTGLLNTLIGSNITKSVGPDQQGAALGVSSGIGCLTRILAPVTGSYLFEKLGPWAPGSLGGFIALTMVLFSLQKSTLQKP
eukprot:Phypoly_transcript_09824.p1 GENE.Phypoly_transcript_09824~~Phypoly_transcript_09824.p1  ORF type:complete len:430 (+),score=34.29 Phypoly_transcript_09824:110-1291(+)